MQLGQPITTTVLDGSQPPLRNSYYSIRLPAGDYKVSTEFRRADGTSGNVGGNVAVLDAEGAVLINSLLNANDIDVSSKKIAKLSLGEEAAIIFRPRAAFTRETLTFTIEKWSAQ